MYGNLPMANTSLGSYNTNILPVSFPGPKIWRNSFEPYQTQIPQGSAALNRISSFRQSINLTGVDNGREQGNLS